MISFIDVFVNSLKAGKLRSIFLPIKYFSFISLTNSIPPKMVDATVSFNVGTNGGRWQLCKLIIPTTPDPLLILILL